MSSSRNVPRYKKCQESRQEINYTCQVVINYTVITTLFMCKLHNFQVKRVNRTRQGKKRKELNNEMLWTWCLNYKANRHKDFYVYDAIERKRMFMKMKFLVLPRFMPRIIKSNSNRHSHYESYSYKNKNLLWDNNTMKNLILVR